MLLRLIFLLIVFFYLLRLLRRFFAPFSARRDNSGPGVRDRDDGAPTVLKSCAACGTFFQERQGVTKNGGSYCSRACADKEPS